MRFGSLQCSNASSDEARSPSVWHWPLTLTALAGVDRPVLAQTAKPGNSPCDIQTTERVVAVGDVHGAFDNFVAILRAAQVIDNRNRWSGRRTVLVQTGDILDRGPDSRKAIDLLRRLERDAQRAGGRVVSLLGNHELMRRALGLALRQRGGDRGVQERRLGAAS